MPDLLNLNRITVRFGGVTALSEVDLAVPAKTIVSVIGPNGAGKTTLLGVASGMVKAAAGQVALDGRDVSRAPAHVRGAAGMVRTFQNLEVFSNMTVLENVMTGCHRHVGYGVVSCLFRTPRFRREERCCREHALMRLDFVGLTDQADSPAVDLPYGLQRRMEIARAVAADPLILLLDEPAAGLNTRETQALGELITAIRDRLGVTVVLVEHDMDLVMRISDRVMVLKEGRNLAVGPPETVQKNPEVIRAYLGEDEDD
ncbi:MAG: ABC transporter ATP-binding protein [Deltaproteobacteria bacterium]|nr:ABC transporter ATP-binding protein [Deltaproteobacteria bacterium]